MSAAPDAWPAVLIPDRTREQIRDGTADYVVIGASGWIGRASLDILWHALGEEEFRKRVHVLGSRTARILVRPELEVACRALPLWRELSPSRCVVIHNAFLTRDRVAGLPQDEYVGQNRAISAQVLALLERFDVLGIVLPSSGAVYGPGRTVEADLAGNPYGALKAEDERAFSELARGRGASVAIPRIFGLSGEYINKLGIYALASVIEAVRTGEPVRLRSRHPVLRSYVYVGDLMALCLAVALSPEPGIETFDTAGEEPVEIGHLARLAAEELGRADHPIIRDYDPDLPADSYLGDPDRIRTLSADRGLRPLGLSDQIARTAGYLYAIAGR